MKVRGRVLLTAAASVAVALTLSGCAALGNFIPHTVNASTKPAVGDCWASSFETAQQAASWTASGAVACVSAHQLYTYAVVKVTSSAKTWRNSDSHDLDDQIATDAYRACNEQFSAQFADAPDGGRLATFFFVAPESEWQKGARWVRCDLGVYRTGSLYANPSFASLPSDIATLEKQLDTTPDLFANCVTTTDASGQTGPLDDPKAVIADCTHDYQWRYESTFTIPGQQNDPYPDDDALNAATQSGCGDAADEDGSDWAAYVPSPDTWAGGDRSGSCWFAASKVPQT